MNEIVTKSPLIVFMLLPERGAYNASFSLARKLREQGCTILYGGPERFLAHVRAQGFDYEILEVGEPEFARLAEAEKQPSALQGWLLTRRIMRHYSQAFYALMARSVNLFKRLDPALVILDPLAWPYAEAPLRSGVPIVLLSTTLASSFDSRIAPVFSDRPPGDASSLRVRFLNAMAWMRCIAKSRFRLWMHEVFFPLSYALAPITSRKRSIERMGGVFRWGEYGPRLQLPELVVAPQAFDFPQVAALSGRTYIGACVDLERSDGTFDWQGVDPDKPLVYCSLGTYGASYPHARRLFVSVIDALKGRPDLQGIVQIGNAASAQAFGEIPAHIKLVEHVPQVEVLQRTAVFITHGGFSSVRESLLAGVPMLVFPCWLDQRGNAARVVYHGAGLQGDIGSVTASGVSTLLAEVFRPAFTERARSMQQIFASQTDCQAGLDLVNALIRARYEEPRESPVPDQQVESSGVA